MARRAKEGRTNYFQLPAIALTAPGSVTAKRDIESNSEKVIIGWSTAFAADAPLNRYEVWRDGSKVGELPFTPQLTTDPIIWTETISDSKLHSYSVKIVDDKDREAQSEPVTV